MDKQQIFPYSSIIIAILSLLLLFLFVSLDMVTLH